MKDWFPVMAGEVTRVRGWGYLPKTAASSGVGSQLFSRITPYGPGKAPFSGWTGSKLPSGPGNCLISGQTASGGVGPWDKRCRSEVLLG